VDLSIDGGGVYNTYPANASTQVNVPCDGNTHTYKITAKGNGNPATQTISIQTHT
jgi:hypothetical protein